MRIRLGRATLATSILALTATGALGQSAVGVGGFKWQPWIEFGGYAGTDNSSRGEIAGFVPFRQADDRLTFLDLRAKAFEDDSLEGNFALGYRQMMSNGWNLGVWGGYDVRNSPNDNTFHQISGGFEALSDLYDIRVNGYVPLNDEEVIAGTAFTTMTGVPRLVGNSAIVMDTTITTGVQRELALWGVDAEVGAKLPFLSSGPNSSGRQHEVRVYGGGFYFDHPDLNGEVAGPKARIEWRINDVIAKLPGSRLTFEAEASWDDVRDERFEFGARLRIPLGRPSTSFASLSPQERRMTEGLERDTDIITEQNTKTTSSLVVENVEDGITGVDLAKVSVVEAANLDDLQDVIDAAGPNTLIIVTGGNDYVGSTIFIGPDQTVQGGASTILVRGLTTGTEAGFTAPGEQPRLRSWNTDLVYMTNNTHLAGFRLREGDDFRHAIEVGGIEGQSVSNVAITSNTIITSGFRSDAIEISADGEGADPINRLVVRNNLIETRGTGSDGILVTEGTRLENALIAVNSIATGTEGGGAFSNGISIYGTLANSIIFGNSIVTYGNYAPGILVNEDGAIESSLIAANGIATVGTDSHGLSIASISDSAIIGNAIGTLGEGSDGIRFGQFVDTWNTGFVRNLEISNNRFGPIADDAVDFQSADVEGVTGTGNTTGEIGEEVCDNGNFSGQSGSFIVDGLLRMLGVGGNCPDAPPP